MRDADRIIGLLQANQIQKVDLIVNRLRMDMVRRGDMMNVEDVCDILAINLIGAVPDDEHIVISTNRGNHWLEVIALLDRHMRISATVFSVRKLHFLIWMQNREYFQN